MNEIAMTQTELTVEDTMIHALQELKKLKEGQSVLSANIDYLKNEQPVNPSICLALEKMRKQKVVEMLGGKDSQAYRDRHFAQSVFSQAAKDFKEYFRIPRYDLLKRKGRRNEHLTIGITGSRQQIPNLKSKIVTDR